MSKEELLFQIEDCHAGERLDQFLANQIEDTSRSAIRRWIDDQAVLVGGVSTKAGYRLRKGDRIEVNIPPPAPTHLIAEDIPLQIHFEDDLLLVVEKPAGMVVHPGSGNPSGTLANALIHHLRRVSHDETIRPGLVHRLDKGTSGLLVVAKDDQTHQFLAQQFKRRKVEKEYLALAYGRIDPGEGSIDTPLGRHPRDRVKFSTRSHKPRTALTEYRTEQELREFSYLRIRLHTGRTHQIRVHLSSLGHPVAGDELYGGNRWKDIQNPQTRSRFKELERLFLHATLLGFEHPRSGTREFFESPLPAELAGLLERLE